MRSPSRIAAAAALAATALTVVPVTASAAEPTLAGPGAPMRQKPADAVLVEAAIMPESLLREVCSQGLWGTVTTPEGEQRTVMITAAHCTHGLVEEPVSEPVVYAPALEGDVELGRAVGGQPAGAAGEDVPTDPKQLLLFFDDVVNSPDWSVVEAGPGIEPTRISDSVDEHGNRRGEPVAITGVRDYRDLGPWEVAFDNFGQPICKDGSRSGRSCGVQLFRTAEGLWMIGTNYQGGDSGGLNFDPVTGEALGVTSQGFAGLDRAQPIDRAIQATYGIPDGQVASHFAVPESAAPHAQMRTISGDEAARNQWVWDQLASRMPAPAPIDAQRVVAEAATQARQAVDDFSARAHQAVDAYSTQAQQVVEDYAGQAHQAVDAYAAQAERVVGEVTRAAETAGQLSSAAEVAVQSPSHETVGGFVTAAAEALR